ncbi:MAG: hypothetical protein ACRC2T_09800 [Thermoguttaceae bacterium]
MKDRNLFLVFIVFIGIFCVWFFFTSGNSNQSNSGANTSGELSGVQSQQNEDAFKNVFELYNTLEETPLLRGFSSVSRELQTVGRLDKWIANRLEDKIWKNDVFFANLEESFRSADEKFNQISSVFSALQNDDNNQVGQSELDKVLNLMYELSTEMKSISSDTSINLDAEIAKLENLAARFARVKNGREAASLARSDQVKAEIAGVVEIQDAFEKFSDLLNIRDFDFQASDADHFKDVVWTRNISSWAKGDKQNPLDRAAALFDWTIRNIDLRDDMVTLQDGRKFPSPPQAVWQTLLLGSGTQYDRIYTFIELLRQQRIDACVLSAREDDSPDSDYIPWAVGVLISNDNGESYQMYLFSLTYGVPIPGPNGIKLESEKDNCGIAYNDIATFSQVIENDSLLRALDLDDSPYKITSEKAKNSLIQIATSPTNASQRMCLIQKELSGEEAMVLYQSYTDQAERLAKVPYVMEVSHWLYPISVAFERIAFPQKLDMAMLPFHAMEPKTENTQNDKANNKDAQDTRESAPVIELGRSGDNRAERYPLWSGRILFFKGKLIGDESAMVFYQSARVSERKLEELARSKKQPISPEMLSVYVIAKRYANFWIALVCYDADKLLSAKETLEREEKEVITMSGLLWANAIAYNLGRCCERLGEYDNAIAQYTKFPFAPTNKECGIRAKWLKQLR